MSFYTGAIKVLGPALRFLFAVKKVEGLENIPTDGGLVCANHTSFADPIIIAAAIKKPVKYMGKAELFKIPVLNWVIKAFGAFPVKRGGADPASIRTAETLLKNGEYVGIFPQGTRCPGIAFEQSSIKNGAGIIAYRSGCRIIPVYIKTRKNKAGLFRRSHIVVGKPIENSEFEFSDGTSREYEKVSKRVFESICQLEAYSKENE